jgi:hypothetical protein
MKRIIVALIVGALIVVCTQTFSARYVVGYAYYCGVLHGRPEALTDKHAQTCAIVRALVEEIE